MSKMKFKYWIDSITHTVNLSFVSILSTLTVTYICRLCSGSRFAFWPSKVSRQQHVFKGEVQTWNTGELSSSPWLKSLERFYWKIKCGYYMVDSLIMSIFKFKTKNFLRCWYFFWILISLPYLNRHCFTPIGQ